MGALSRLLSRLSLYSSAAGLVGMTIIIGWQVYARYVLNSSPSWTEQAALYLMGWFILFAAAAGVREGFHIRLTMLQDLSSPTIARVLRVICHLVVLVFGLFMIKGGLDLIIATWQHSIPSLAVPRGSAYIPIAGAGALIVFFTLEHIIGEASGREVTPIWS
jgi:TRAP-type C4-dicarboxylate transport system permease small subunit